LVTTQSYRHWGRGWVSF